MSANAYLTDAPAPFAELFVVRVEEVYSAAPAVDALVVQKLDTTGCTARTPGRLVRWKTSSARARVGESRLGSTRRGSVSLVPLASGYRPVHRADPGAGPLAVAEMMVWQRAAWTSDTA